MPSPFKGFQYFSKKVGGANLPGKHGGIYLNADNQKVLIKQDTDRNGKLRADKVIAKVVVAKMMRGLLKLIGSDVERSANVSFVRVAGVTNDPTVVNTYISSVYFENYKKDFWEYAYDQSQKQLPKHRPSGLAGFFPTSLKKITSQVLRSDSRLKEDFCELSALRLFLADFSVHSGNFGIVETTNAKGKIENRLVAYDFGAGCKRLLGRFDPFSRLRNMRLYRIYTNHFFEYDEDIIKSLSFAKMLIKIGNIPKHEIQELTHSIISEVIDVEAFQNEKGYPGSALCRFCERAGLKQEKYKNLPISQAIENLDFFMQQQLKARQMSLLNVGSSMILKHFRTFTGKFDLEAFKKEKEMGSLPEWKTLLQLIQNRSLALSQGFSSTFCADAEKKLNIILICELLDQCKEKNDALNREKLFSILEQNKDLIPEMHKFIANRKEAAKFAGYSLRFLQHTETIVEAYRYHLDTTKKIKIGFFDRILPESNLSNLSSKKSGPGAKH